MSATTIANLIVSLEANTAKFTTEMRSAAQVTKQVGNDVKAAGAIIKETLVGLASAFSVHAAVEWGKAVVEDAANLQDLSESTGASVEQLSRLHNQVKIAGGEIATFDQIVLKLSAGMAGVEDENSRVGRAMEALGVQSRDPAEALQLIADKLATYADGIGKAAIARDLFGKAGPAFLSVLKDMANAHHVAATVTTEQAEAAKLLGQQIRELEVNSTTLKNVVLSEVVPALNRFIQAMRLGRQEGLGWIASFDTAVLEADQIGLRLGELGTKTEELSKKIAGAQRYGFTDWLKDWQEELQKTQAQTRVLIALRNELIMQNVARMGPADSLSGTGDMRDVLANRKPILKYTGAHDAAAGVDEYAKALESAAKIAAGAQLTFDHLFDVEPITAAQRALTELMATDKWDKFTGKQKEAIKAAFDHAGGIEKQTNALKRAADLTEKMIELEEQEERERRRQGEANVAVANSYELGNQTMQREIDLIGQDELAHRLLVEQLAFEAEARKISGENADMALEKLRAKHVERIKLIQTGFRREQVVAALDEQRALAKRTYDEVSGYITDALMRGFEAGKGFAENFRQTLKNMFNTLILRPVISAITAPLAAGIAGLASPASAAGVGGVGGVMQSANTLSSLYNAATGGLTNMGTGFALSGIGQGLGLSAPLASLPGSLSLGVEAAGAAEGVMSLTSLGAGLVAALPWVALAAIAVPMIVRLFDKGDAMRTADFASNAALGPGNKLFQSRSAFGTFGLTNDRWFSDEMAQQIGPLLQTITGLDDAIATAVGPALTEKIKGALSTSHGYDFGMEHTDLGASGVAGAILKDRYTTVLNALDPLLGHLLDGFAGTGQEMATFVMQLVAMHNALADTAATAKLFGQAIGVPELEAAARDGEKLSDTFTRLSSDFAVTNAVAQALGRDATIAFGAVGLASTDARESLIALAGGADALASKTSFYAQNFLTDGERIAIAQRTVSEEMERLGLASVTTVDQFKAVVNGIDLTTEAGQTLFAQLMNIAPAFYQVATAVDAVADTQAAIMDSVRGMLTGNALPDALASIESQWDQLAAQGDKLDTLAAYYTGTADATEALQQATNDYYASLVRMIGVIEELKGSIASLFADSTRYYQMAGLDPHQQYAFLQQETAGMVAELRTATDPARINALAQQINANQRAAFGLLTPEEQAQVKDKFVDAARAANALAQDQLAAAEQAAVEREEKLAKDVRDALLEAAGKMSGAGDKQGTAAQVMGSAAAAMLRAANTPLVVRHPVESDVNA